jgi:hypothetical protein
MEYTINGTIAFAGELQLKLASEVDYISASKARISLSSESPDKLSVLVKLEADNDTTAEEVAQLELNRICNVLSFYKNIRVAGSRITGMSHTVVSDGKVNMVMQGTLNITGRVNVVLILDDTAFATLASHMKQDYPSDFEEVILMWRWAISSESSVERFLSLYRLMECLFDVGRQTGKRIDDWIKTTDSSVRLFLGNEYRHYEHTVYTHVRDRAAHYRVESKLLPLNEIQENLPTFQTLVHQKIEEKYTIQRS